MHTATSSQRPLPPVPFPRTRYKETEPVPEVDVKMRSLSAGILSVLTQNCRFRCKNLTYEQRQGFNELRELRSNGTIRISVSDKGGEFVVMSQTLDRQITELHLADTSIYRQATEREFHSQCRRLNNAWMEQGQSAGLNEKLLSRLRLDSPDCPVFYSLVKTHKLAPGDMMSTSPETFKIRPIISCVGRPTDRISWFLNCIVSQLLTRVPSHLTNTTKFLELLRSSRLTNTCVVESFDVTSLYTNVQNDQALQALSEMLDRYVASIETYGLDKAHIMTLIKACLECNIFKWSGAYYATLTYRKASSKNILIHATSAHPSGLKHAMVKNMFKTAANVCTGVTERQESIRLAADIAASNGYTVPHVHRRTHTERPSVPRQTRQSKVPLCIPFISDNITAAIQRCLTRAQLANDVVLVNIPNDNIRRQLVRNRLYDKQCISEQCIICPNGRVGDCAKVGVIYQLECQTCNATYIGETGRALATRIKEHLAGKRRGNLTTPLGKHLIEEHCGDDYDVKCKILAYETEVSARKALEAFWISARNPRMNNRNECLSITNDLMPFSQHCQLL